MHLSASNRAKPSYTLMKNTPPGRDDVFNITRKYKDHLTSAHQHLHVNMYKSTSTCPPAAPPINTYTSTYTCPSAAPPINTYTSTYTCPSAAPPINTYTSTYTCPPAAPPINTYTSTCTNQHLPVRRQHHPVEFAYLSFFSQQQDDCTVRGQELCELGGEAMKLFHPPPPTIPSKL